MAYYDEIGANWRGANLSFSHGDKRGDSGIAKLDQINSIVAVGNDELLVIHDSGGKPMYRFTRLQWGLKGSGNRITVLAIQVENLTERKRSQPAHGKRRGAAR